MNHHMNNRGYGPALLSTVFNSTLPGGFGMRSLDPAYSAVRASEQKQIEYYQKLGVSGNFINGISPNNKLRETYFEALQRWKE